MSLKTKETKPISLRVDDALRGMRAETPKIDTSKFRAKPRTEDQETLVCRWCGKPISECVTGGRYM